MNGVRLQTVVIVAQFLTIFVAITTVLGRVYFISYHEFIGVPLLEDPSNVLVYAIISPDIAIASIGIILIVLSFLYFRTHVRTVVDRIGKPLGYGVPLLVLGALVFYVGTFPIVDGFEVFADRRLSKGLEGIFVVLGFASLNAGILFLARWHRARQPKDERQERLMDEIEKESEKNNIGLIQATRNVLTARNVELAMLSVWIVVSSLIILVMFAITTGHREARNDYSHAVRANLMLTREAFRETDRSGDFACSGADESCDVAVLLLRDDFIFVRPSGTDDIATPSTDKLVIHAIPVDGVRRVVYFPEGTRYR